MKNYLKTIGKSALVAGLITVSYLVGLNKNPSFQELPQKAQQAVVETHQDLNTLLTQAVDQYKSGNPKKALEFYRQVEQEAESLEKIDPQYENIEAGLSRYRCAIIDTGEVVGSIDSLYENVVAGTPERIADYVTLGGSLSWEDRHLEIIGPDSCAYHRLNHHLEGDIFAQTALLNYYVESSLRWYDAQEQMRETLKSSPNKTEQVNWAIEILDKRMERIKKDRDWTNKFKQEIND